MKKLTPKQTAELIIENMKNGDRNNLSHLEHVTGKMPNFNDLHPKVQAAIAASPEALVIMANHESSTHEVEHKYKAPAKKGSITLAITRKLTKGEACLTDDNGDDVNLPAPIFGAYEIASDYTRVCAAFLPADGSVLLKSFSRTADGQGLIFTYQNQDDSINETVTIRAKNKGCVYTNLLQGLSASAFVVVGPSLIIKDATKNDQFGVSIGTFTGSMFTKGVNDSIDPDEQKKEYLSDDKIRILRNSFEITPEDTLIFSIIPPTLVETNESNVGSNFTLDVVCPLENIHRVAS